jgi:perosamine synthetase
MNFVPVNEPLLDGNEKTYLLDCIDSGWISSEGPYVKKFEEQFSSLVDRKFGIAVANGSGALEIAVVALGLGKDDEVIMPTFTIISCAAPLIRVGAVPILVDSDPITWNMDVAQVEGKITKKTKAIMVVHTYGLPVDMDPILNLAQKYGLRIIEDAAEAHGQFYRGKPCGSFGDISVFSFYPNKHVTTGEGGMLVTNDQNLADKSRSLRNLCFQEKTRFIHEELGWNYRMTNLQAAIGVAQLERLDTFIEKKKRMGARYTSLLSELSGIELPIRSRDYAENNYWVYGVVLGEGIAFNALDAMQKLAKFEIATRPFFWPMHEQPVFKKMGYFGGECYPVSEKIARRGFYLPSGLALTEDQQDRVTQAMKAIFT